MFKGAKYSGENARPRLLRGDMLLSSPPPMQNLLDLAPLVAFLVAYYAADLYTATAVLMVAMALLLVVDYVRERRIPPMHALSAVLVFAFGAATLALHDQR